MNRFKIEQGRRCLLMFMAIFRCHIINFIYLASYLLHDGSATKHPFLTWTQLGSVNKIILMTFFSISLWFDVNKYYDWKNDKTTASYYDPFKKGIKWWIKDTYTKYMNISCLLLVSLSSTLCIIKCMLKKDRIVHF